MNDTVKQFAYAAALQGGTRSAGIEILNALILSGFSEDTVGSGKVMISATATNKSFSYQLPAGYGVKEIRDATFSALRLLTTLTDDNYLASLLRLPQSVAAIRYC